jgi:2-methylisocitrate lyase-like PEP mutase family enzyme
MSNDRANYLKKSAAFKAMHRPGKPLILVNIWDVGSASAVAAAGASALATGSWGVAAAQGFSDGQAIPLSQVEQLTQQIVGHVDLPVSIDFEGAYATDPQTGALNVMRLVSAGAVGINFEDQIVGGTALHDIADQAKRIAQIAKQTQAVNPDFFINARTDIFLKAADPASHPALLTSAIVTCPPKPYHF